MLAVISIRKLSSSPPFHSSKTTASASLSKPLRCFSNAYASEISCISPYSIPLCTIFTKWPAPPAPIHSQQGVPSSSLAAMPCRISFTSGQASAEPPGITDGPCKAPSSPPEMPVPTKYMPFSSTSFTRRSVSWKSEFPPSIITSPGDRNGVNCAISSSTGRPALTIIMILRGRLTASTNCSMECVPMKCLSFPRPPVKRSTTPSSPGALRLYTATVKPLLSIFSARFSPITASPINPISAFISYLFYFILNKSFIDSLMEG